MATHFLKKIGIFLAFAPEQSMKSHGIGRLLCFLILAANEIKFTIAIPSWYHKELMEVLEDHHIHRDRYTLISPPKQPYILQIKSIFQRFLKKKEGKSWFKKQKNRFSKLTKKMMRGFIYGLTSASFSLFLTSVFVALGTGLFLIYFLFPINLIIIPVLIVFLFLKLRKALSIKQNESSPSRYSEFYHRYKKYILAFNQPLKQFKHHVIAQKIYSALYQQEIKQLIRLVNTQHTIKTWFIPTLFWPEISAIKAMKIVAAPDIVFLEFPHLFTQPTYAQTYKKIRDTLDAADHLICYSEHVKQCHLIEAMQVASEKITVIPHAPTNLAHYFCQSSENSMTREALNKVKHYQRQWLCHDPYLCDFDFTDTRFIFYASQIRPHKNFLNLLKAYSILLRQHYLGIKLIVTADIQSVPEIAHFILKNSLQHDVLSLHNLSSEMLAALNHLAICAVNPTLFEGGFPFTFAEAYSVGTPSVMSRIPVVEAVVDASPLQNRMLFDPYQVDDMVEKIAWAIAHRDELYQAQHPLYEKLAARSWQNVAEEYLQVFSAL